MGTNGSFHFSVVIVDDGGPQFERGGSSDATVPLVMRTVRGCVCVCVCVSGLALTRVCLSLGHRWKMEDGPREVAFLLHFTCCSSVSVCPPVGLLHEAVSGAPAISIIDVAGKSRQHVAETVAVTVAETFI